jgi:glycosyltransferase involved in cell wall biosynthesis
MKIVLVNYRFFISGGPERYYFNIKEILEKNGHEVIPFSVKSARNQDAGEYEKYFLDIVDDEVYFAQARKKTPRMILKSFTRMFYSFEAKRKFGQLLDDTKPDLVYIMHFHNKISPSIIDAARMRGVHVVHRISDFQYMCPNALFYNDRIGVCEDCLKEKLWSCVKYRCVMNSPVYSGIKMMAKWLHDMMGVTKKIDAFVVPSEFTLGKLMEYGIPKEKLHHIPTFFNLKEENPQVEYRPYFLFVGRIEKQKGLMTLVKAFENTKYELRIIGFSNDGYEDELKQYLGRPINGDLNIEDSSMYGKNGNIHFLGRKSFEKIVPYLKSCLCTLVPSEWYDNFPNVVLESYAYKKAVIATDFGSLKYMVEDGRTGLTFRYKDVEDLRGKIAYMYGHRDEAICMGEAAFRQLVERYSPKAHYEQLMRLFDRILN